MVSVLTNLVYDTALGGITVSNNRNKQVDNSSTPGDLPPLSITADADISAKVPEKGFNAGEFSSIAENTSNSTVENTSNRIGENAPRDNRKIPVIKRSRKYKWKQGQVGQFDTSEASGSKTQTLHHLTGFNFVFLARIYKHFLYLTHYLFIPLVFPMYSFYKFPPIIIQL